MPKTPEHLPEISFLPTSPDEGSSFPGMLVRFKDSDQNEALTLDPEAVRLIPSDLIHRYRVLPLEVQDNLLYLAMVDPGDLIAIDDIRLITGFDIEPVQVDEASMAAAFSGGVRPRSLEAQIETIFPLQELDMRARLTGPCAAVTVSQTFANPCQETIGAHYLFPLPAGAAVTEFRMVVGTRVVEGKVQEKAAARRTFQAANQAGRRTALLEHQSDRLFQLEVGNIPPQEQVKIELRYAHKLELNELETTFRFPLVAPPLPGDNTPRTLACGSHTGAKLSLLVELETAGRFPRSISSSQHATWMELSAAGNPRIQLSRENEFLDRDFILRYQLQGQETEAMLLTGEEHFLLQLTPPGQAQPTKTPRDMVFFVDRSGSMTGIKMDHAKQALNRFLSQAGPEDRFALYAFDDRLECFNGGRLTGEVEAGVNWVNRLQARGGTSLHEAIDTLVDYRPEVGRLLCAVVITDGQVCDEQGLLKKVQQNPDRARIFTLGIDTCVNGAFLRRLADLGRGDCELLTPGEDLSRALERLDRSTRSAVVTQLRLVDRGFHFLPGSLSPNPIPDLFSSRPLFISGRRLGLGEGHVEVAGQLPDGNEWKQTLEPTPSSNPALGVLWAQDRVRLLEDEIRLADPAEAEKLKKECLGLALEYGLVTRYTSFVLVDEREVVEEPMRISLRQPSEFPADWDVTDLVEVEETVKDISAQDFGPLEFEDEVELDRLKEMVEESPIVRVVNLIISQAINDQASHVHIEPEARSVRVRYRVDGVLHEVMNPPKHIQQAIVARLMTLAGLNWGEPWPQAGGMELEHDGNPYHLWVSTCPTSFGDKVVLEIQSASPDWSSLGPATGALEDALRRPGRILICGLARSGYRRTLYECASRLVLEGSNVVYWDESAPAVAGVTQLALRAPATEASMIEGLRNQDMDALVVRPLETPLPPLECSLVVAGVTAPDTLTAWERLGGPVDLIVAQARVRKLCSRCTGKGCDRCKMVGFQGHLTFFEVLPVTEEVRRARRQGKSLTPYFVTTLEEQATLALDIGFTTEAELERSGLLEFA